MCGENSSQWSSRRSTSTQDNSPTSINQIAIGSRGAPSSKFPKQDIEYIPNPDLCQYFGIHKHIELGIPFYGDIAHRYLYIEKSTKSQHPSNDVLHILEYGKLVQRYMHK